MRVPMRAFILHIEPSALRLQRPAHVKSQICIPLIDGSSAQTSVFAPSLLILAISSILGSSHSLPLI